MKRMLFMFNPHAGRGKIAPHLSGIMDGFIKAGYCLEVHVTQNPGDGEEVVTQRAGEVERLVVSGGDGILHEAVCGMMRLPEGKRPVLGYIPAGTTNDFAQSLALPKSIQACADFAANGSPELTDIGQFGEEYFTYVAGFGAFTDVSYQTPQDTKNLLGHQAYILEALKRLSEVKPHHAVVQFGGRMIEDDFLVCLVTNSISVAGIKNLAGKQVELSDGLFEVILIRNPKNPLDLTKAIQEFLANEENASFVVRFKANQLSFHTSEPIDWVLDGEFGGSRTDVEIQICPKAVRIVRKK